MEANKDIVEPLFEKVAQYCKTSFALIKLQSLSKTADVSSTMFSRLLLIIVLSMFALTLNIAIALWLGDVLGKNYYGFLVVAFFYALAAIILYLVHPRIKARLNRTIITEMLN